MSLADAAHALEELAAGRTPSQSRAVRGLHALDELVLKGHCERALRDAAATLELYVATGGVISIFAGARARAGVMAAAIRRAMDHG